MMDGMGRGRRQLLWLRTVSEEVVAILFPLGFSH